MLVIVNAGNQKTIQLKKPKNNLDKKDKTLIFIPASLSLFYRKNSNKLCR